MKKNICISKLLARFNFIIIVFYCQSLYAQHESSDSLITKRTQEIQKTLNRDKVNTQRWWYGWLAEYSAATLMQGTIGALSDTKKTRQDMFLGAISTSLGAIGLFTSPVSPYDANDSLSCFSGDNPDNRSLKLKYAEELLKTIALREQEARSWKTHAVCSVVNLSCGLITWLGFKRTIWDGVENFAINTLVTEAQIWTVPSRARKEYRNYRRIYNTVEKSYTSISDLNWSVNVYPGKIQIILVF